MTSRAAPDSTRVSVWFGFQDGYWTQVQCVCANCWCCQNWSSTRSLLRQLMSSPESDLHLSSLPLLPNTPNSIGIAWLTSFALPTLSISCLKTFQSVERALFNGQCCFKAPSSSCRARSSLVPQNVTFEEHQPCLDVTRKAPARNAEHLSRDSTSLQARTYPPVSARLPCLCSSLPSAVVVRT